MECCVKVKISGGWFGFPDNSKFYLSKFRVTGEYDPLVGAHIFEITAEILTKAPYLGNVLTLGTLDLTGLILDYPKYSEVLEICKKAVEDKHKRRESRTKAVIYSKRLRNIKKAVSKKKEYAQERARRIALGEDPAEVRIAMNKERALAAEKAKASKK